ncbi:hypothetical protein EV121DRAFT_297789, partial [Schizophyllum commune]
DSIHATLEAARAKNDGHEFPAAHLKKLVEHYAQDSVLLQDRAMFRASLAGIYDVLDRFAGGLKGHELETIAGLLSRYMDREKLFGGSIEAHILALREKYKDDLDQVASSSTHHWLDSSDGQSWYLLGRAFMAGQKYNKAYKAYQQAVHRDSRNPTFWCSISVLYFQPNQFRDAHDANSCAIRINPYISEVSFDLGSLYESCNNQISDAIDVYTRASELEPSNQIITQHLQLLKNAQINGMRAGAAPGPQDVHPTVYANIEGRPLCGSAALRIESRGPGKEMALPPPSPSQMTANARSGSPPFRGGRPLPVVLDDRHPPSHTPPAPMKLDRGDSQCQWHIDPFYTQSAGARSLRSSSPAAPAPAPMVAVRGRSPASWHQRRPNSSPVMSNRHFAMPQREYDSSPMDNVRSRSRNQAAQQQDTMHGPEPRRREPSPPMGEQQRSVSRSSVCVSRRYLQLGMEEGPMPGYKCERKWATPYDLRMDLGNERDAMEADRHVNYEGSP